MTTIQAIITKLISPSPFTSNGLEIQRQLIAKVRIPVFYVTIFHRVEGGKADSKPIQLIGSLSKAGRLKETRYYFKKGYTFKFHTEYQLVRKELNK